MSRDQISFLALLILHTFAAYSFCHLVYLQYRQYRIGKPVWGDWAWRALTVGFALIYLRALSGYVWFVFSDGRATEDPFVFHLANIITRPLIGPVVMQFFYITERNRLPPHLLWHAAIRAAWALALPMSVLWTLSLFGLNKPWAPGLPDLLRSTSDVVLTAGVLFGIVIILISHRGDDNRSQRRRRQWYFALACVFVIDYLAATVRWTPYLDFLAKYGLTMAFVLVTVYYGERLTFFDIFVKRFALFFLALIALVAYSALIVPYLEFHRLAYLKGSVTALTVLPFVLAAPWVYSTLSSWIDRAWLGRRFSPIEASTHFSESLQGALNEEELLERAESTLSEIFQSKVCIDCIETPRGTSKFNRERGELTSVVLINARPWGVISILPRPDDTPFLSEDAELLRMLGRTLGSVLDSQRLRAQRVCQEQREQELVLSATRSELKALRAQINPHFLFNALNTIAALISKNPGHAEQTVEQLAEVFRYALRRSDREWVPLAEEIEFVRSYLQIEQTRFGERLKVQIELEDGLENIRIPAMIIQILAENAVKHGITAIRGSGLITVSANLTKNGSLASRVLVRVGDNGPGFPEEFRFAWLAQPSAVGGHGLKNIQQRLIAHYGSNTTLQFGRDAFNSATVVFFEIPAVAYVTGSE